MFSQGLEKTEKPARKDRSKRFVGAPSICILANYAIVKRAADALGLLEVGERSAWNVLWTDSTLTVQQCLAVERFQMVNFFPGIHEITRKDLLARNLGRMQKAFPDDYDFFPKTWWLPADFKELQRFSKLQKGCYYIAKPGSSSQGRGIFISRSVNEMVGLQQYVCQVYLHQPLLIDGYKFDMRIYTLITSCDPLRIYVFNEGIARFATQKYTTPSAENSQNVFMHLTNYSINKYSHQFLTGEKGSKRRTSAVTAWLKAQGLDAHLVWNEVDDVIIKTVITAADTLKREYKMCFPRNSQGCFILLGFDILLDAELKPHVVEVNRCPSLNTDSPIDKEIKESLLIDIFKILNLRRLDQHRVQAEEKKKIFENSKLLIKKIAQKTNAVVEEQAAQEVQPQDAVKKQAEWEESHLGNFRLVYPNSNGVDYNKFLAEGCGSSLFQETAASRARKLAILKSMQQMDADIVPALDDFSLKEDEMHTSGSLVSRGRITSLSSFEPTFINQAEERERLKEMEKREAQLRQLKMRAAVFAAMRQNGLLRANDVHEKCLQRVKYAVLPKINPDFKPFEAAFHSLQM